MVVVMVVASQYVGDDLLTTSIDHRRLKQA
jgi:hypothetical protein